MSSQPGHLCRGQDPKPAREAVEGSARGSGLLKQLQTSKTSAPAAPLGRRPLHLVRLLPRTRQRRACRPVRTLSRSPRARSPLPGADEATSAAQGRADLYGRVCRLPLPAKGGSLFPSRTGQRKEGSPQHPAASTPGGIPAALPRPTSTLIAVLELEEEIEVKLLLGLHTRHGSRRDPRHAPAPRQRWWRSHGPPRRARAPAAGGPGCAEPRHGVGRLRSVT